MSTHDRGAFGVLLAEARRFGARVVRFYAHLDVDDESPKRWGAYADGHGCPAQIAGASGRTGEEALRRLVEQLRAGAPPA